MARAKEIVHNAKRIAKDGTEIWSPAGLADFYQESMYPRDFYYTVDACPECFTNEQLRKAIAWLIARQSPDGAIPNSVFIDGHPAFWLADNSQFMVNLVHLYVSRSGDNPFFAKYSPRLEKAMAAIPRNPRTQLVTTDQPKGMYGFNDALKTEGDDLFTSLLFFEAGRKMQSLYQRLNQPSEVNRWKAETATVLAGLQSLYDPAGYFYACSQGPNRLPSVWGSAFAVYAGATTPKQTEAIGKWLCKNYDGYVQAGQVRHLIKPLYWNNVPWGRDVYQNGGYWATPFAWVDRAIRNADPALADRMLVDVLDDFQKHGINEVVNYDVGYLNRAGHGGEYCASLAPLITLRELGIPFTPGYQNLALARHGGKATASSVLDNGKNIDHQIRHINDGQFGNQHSWIPNTFDEHPWLQVAFTHESSIDMIIFGRDNWTAHLINSKEHTAPNRTGLSDRNIRSFSVQVSKDGRTWSEPIYSDLHFQGLQAGDNCVIQLPQLVQCRYIKFNFLPNSACIDEFEVWGALRRPVKLNDRLDGDSRPSIM